MVSCSCRRRSAMGVAMAEAAAGVSLAGAAPVLAPMYSPGTGRGVGIL